MKTYKKGDEVNIDCGYNGMDDTRPCRLLEDPKPAYKLFGDEPDRLCSRVEILGTGETFTAILP